MSQLRPLLARSPVALPLHPATPAARAAEPDHEIP
jgi:hypothetical protein